MAGYRLSNAAQGDVLDILRWTQAQFGEAARLRYQRLITAGLRDLASQPDRPGSLARPELGPGIRTWHLRVNRAHLPPGPSSVRRPRHFLIYRIDPGFVVVARVLHDAMEQSRHLDADSV